MTARANVIILVTALVLPLALIALIATYGVNVPFWDDWRWAALILKSEAGRLAFADLWRSNGEHRNLVPSLLALGLARFGGYDTVRESFFSVACVTATLVFALVLLRRTLPAQLVAPLFVPIALLLFSLAQAQNWLWGFQVSWFVANLALFAQVTALGSRRLGIPELSLGAAAALIAVFSCAFGLSTLATGALLLGVRRPLPRRALALWIAGSVLVALVYAQGLPLAQPQYHALHDAGVWQRLGFLLVFEGAPLAGWLGNLWSGVLGLFALALGAALAVAFTRLMRTDARAAAAWSPWMGVLLFGVLGGALTAAGRSGMALDFARSARYVTPATTTWVALLPLTTLAFLRIERPRRRAARALALASGFALYLFAGANVEGLALFRGTNALLEQHLALVRNYKNVSDATLTNSLFAVPAGLALMRGTRDPDPDRIRELIARLDAAHEGPFR